MPTVPLLGLLAAISIVAILLAFSIFPFGDDRWRPVGSIDELNDREVLFVPELRTYVVAGDDGAPIALIARSPQMGEPVDYCPTSGWFEDAAHGSKFDGVGRYALGPAPRGLDRYPTTVRDGIVLIDPSRTLLGSPRGDGSVASPHGPFCVAGDP